MSEISTKVGEDTNVCSNYLKNLMNLDILETLIERSKLFCYTNVHYYLFSKSGFTKGCMEKAEKMGNVTLVSYADIIGSF